MSAAVREMQQEMQRVGTIVTGRRLGNIRNQRLDGMIADIVMLPRRAVREFMQFAQRCRHGTQHQRQRKDRQRDRAQQGIAVAGAA